MVLRKCVKTDWGTRWNVWKCKANDNVATRQCDAYKTLEGVWKSIKRPFSMSFSIPPDPLPLFDDGIGRGGKEEKKVNHRTFLYTKSTFSLSFPFLEQIRSGRRVLCTGPTTIRNKHISRSYPLTSGWAVARLAPGHKYVSFSTRYTPSKGL